MFCSAEGVLVPHPESTREEMKILPRWGWWWWWWRWGQADISRSSFSLSESDPDRREQSERKANTERTSSSVVQSLIKQTQRSLTVSMSPSRSGSDPSLFPSSITNRTVILGSLTRIRVSHMSLSVCRSKVRCGSIITGSAGLRSASGFIAGIVREYE